MQRRKLGLAFVALALMMAIATPASAATVRLRLVASSTSINFGNVPVGEETSRQVVYVTNQSKVPLRWQATFYSYGQPAEFNGWLDQDALTDLTASCYALVTIAPGQTCGLEVLYFAPASVGTKTFQIDARFTDGLTEVRLVVTAKGRGI